MDIAKFFSRSLIVCFIGIFFVACGGTREYRLENVRDISVDRKLRDGASLKVSTIPVFNHTLGFYHYELHLKEAVEKQYSHCLKSIFEGGVKEAPAETNVVVTALDTSIFPIASLIIDIRVYFKVEIFDKDMRKQQTVMIYGFGSDEDGSIALEKAVANSFYQLVPILEEMFPE